MKDFDEAMRICMLSEIGPWFKEDHPACVSGIVRTKADRVATGDVNDPKDLGGHTRFGIAKNSNPTLNISTLTYPQAKRVYFSKYWDASECDLLPSIVNVINFDAVVNHGSTNANKFLQRSVGILGKNVDGVLGPNSLKQVALITKNKEQIKVLCLKMLDERERFFRVIVARNPSQRRFLQGWLNRVARLRDYVKSV